jgi:hypothetical protein
MPNPDHTTADKKNREICLTCYLPTCFADHCYLSRYCPIKVAKRFKLDTATVLELNQACQTNQRWRFVEMARERAGAIK